MNEKNSNSIFSLKKNNTHNIDNINKSNEIEIVKADIIEKADVFEKADIIEKADITVNSNKSKKIINCINKKSKIDDDDDDDESNDIDYDNFDFGDKYIKYEKKGEGTFGIVFRLLDKETNINIAGKILKNNYYDGHEDYVDESHIQFSEIYYLKNLQPHTNIIKYINKEYINNKHCIFFRIRRIRFVHISKK